ncbi:hypothetical protein ACE198_06735 [Neobacillus sp. KR4-4]|uniref:hypothetical protein n=1 Tax=Neobacillus sp. KR4-4 TaxID=3344872 RepID=UPI0035C98591
MDWRTGVEIPFIIKLQFYLGTFTVVAACAFGIWIRLRLENKRDSKKRILNNLTDTVKEGFWYSLGEI